MMIIINYSNEQPAKILLSSEMFVSRGSTDIFFLLSLVNISIIFLDYNKTVFGFMVSSIQPIF